MASPYISLNAGTKYVNGLKISKSDARKILVKAGSARDSQNEYDIYLREDVVIDAGRLKYGANLLDKPDFAISVSAITAAPLTATYNNGASGVGATLTNAGAFAALIIDGYAVSVGDIIIVKDQVSTFQNGKYIVRVVGDAVSVNWVLERSFDYDAPNEILPGDLFLSGNGVVNINESYQQTATVTTVGVDPILFSIQTEFPLVEDRWYAVYLIGDTTEYMPSAGTLSLNMSTPTLPSGYDVYRRIGWVRTDPSANFLKFYQHGEGQNREYWWDAPSSVLATGNAIAFTEVDLISSVPPVSCSIKAQIDFTSANAADVVEFLPFGSAASSGVVVFGTNTVGLQRVSSEIPINFDGSQPKILYKVTDAGDSLDLSVAGYCDILA